MSAYERFDDEILKKAAAGSDGHPTEINVVLLASEYRIPVAHVTERLLGMQEAGLIRLSVPRDKVERSRHDYHDADSFFFNKTNTGYVRIRLLSRGAELLYETARRPIGFASERA